MLRPSDPSFGTQRWLPAAILALFTVVGFALYAPTFDSGFVLDDVLSVSQNRSIRDLTRLGTVLSPDPACTVGGRPLANLSFALNYSWGGETPRGYRITNWLLHASNAWLFFALLRTLARTRSASPQPASAVAQARVGVLGALIASAWLLHPLCTATVAYISQRTELLMTTCYVGCAVLFMRSTRSPQPRVGQAACIVVCALGMASKEIMATAPVALLLLDAAWVSGSVMAALRRRRAFYGVLALTWIPLALLLRDVGQRAVGFGQGVGVGVYALTECKALALYFAKALWPATLVFDYGAVFLAFDPVSCLWLVVPLAGLAALVQLWRYSRRAALGCSLWLLVLLPTSSVVPVAAQPIAENRTYLPTLILLGLLWCLLSRSPRRWVMAALLALLFPLGAISFARLSVMAEPLTLWRDTIAKAPLNPRAYANLGEIYLGQAEWNQAAAYLAQAVALKNDYPEPRANLGIALANLQQGEAAEAHLRAAVALAPDRPAYQDNLGNLLLQRGKISEATLQFEKALALNPDFGPALNNLAGIYARSNDFKQAASLYARAISADPAADLPQLNLAAVLIADHRPAEAQQALAALLRLQPEHPAALLASASASLLSGDAQSALVFARRTIAARSDWPEAHLMLAKVSLAVGQPAEAAPAIQTALRLRPGWPEAEELRARLAHVPPR